MKNLYRRILLVAVFFLPLLAFSQEAKKDDKQAEPKSSRAQRKLAKMEWRERRKTERAEKKKVKDHHKRLQTKDVQKRMKKDRQKAEDLHDHKRTFFLKRWFSKS